MLELRLFGAAELRVAGQRVPTPPPKELALLSYLALRNTPVPRAELHAVLWPGGGKGGLRVALSRLRDVAGSDEWLETGAGLVGVKAESDVARFESLLRSGDPGAALAAWPDDRGELLAGVQIRHAEPFSEWLEVERTRLAELRADARRRLLREFEQRRSFDAAFAVAMALLEADDLDEAALRAVMRLEHARGNTEAALAQFERLRVRLRQELGAEPAPETLAELARIEGYGGTANVRALLLGRGDEVPGRAAWMLGRSEELKRLEEALHTSGRALLYGAGGMGKSTLAAEATARLLQRGGKALWVPSRDAEPAAVFDALAAALAARSEVARSSSPTAAIRHVLDAEGVALVVLDDASNAYTVATVSEALPDGCALLVSSRHRYSGLPRVRLDRLARGEARELLELHARRFIPETDADALCALLGDHPFAVRIAGVALSTDEASVAVLMGRVRESPHALALPQELAESGRESVAALLQVSLEELPDDAHEALMAWGALSVPIATPELLAEVTRRDAEAIEEALGALQARALADRLVEAGSDVVRYRVHDLTHSLARANTHVRRTAAQGACLRFLERHAHEHDLLDAELGQLVTAVREILERGGEREAVEAMERLCGPEGYFNGRGHTPASLALLERAAAVAEEIDPSAAQLLYVKLGNGRRELLGDLVAARDDYERAAELAHAVGDARREAIARSAMGCVAFTLGDEQGEATVAAALALARETGDDLALAHTLQNLSYVAGQKGHLNEAADLSEEAVAAADRLGSDVDPQEVDRKRFFARFNLGVARWRGGQPDRGRAALEGALSIARQRVNPNWEAYALHELADLEDAAGNATTARKHARAALALYDRHRMRRDARTLRAWLDARGAGA